MPIKVSVVVAVYNPGRHIDGLIRSLDEQSLSPDDFEVIFVDDGSTDGTRERLEAIARTRPHFTVTSIPNSGWPGRPRNIGTDLARGDYVFYADNDDEFFPEALERLHAMAIENGSDIVYGKVVRAGRNTPYWSLARRNIAVADPLQDDIVSSRTVHKLYRRDFLTKHAIRFPEGKVRLEDHTFMAQALPLAEVVSVLADYPCYRWNHHDDGSNNSSVKIDYDEYWEYFVEALRIFRRIAGPGEFTDAALVSGIERMFYPIRASRYLQRNTAERLQVFDPLHRLVNDELPERLDERVPVLKRARLHALRVGDRDLFDRLQELRFGLTFAVRLDSAAWQDGKLHVSVTASLDSRWGALVGFERSGDDLLLPPQPEDDLPVDKRVLLPKDHGVLEVTLRHRASRVEWPLEGSHRTESVETGKGVGLRAGYDAVIDPTRNYFGAPLEPGIWDVLARVQFLGDNEVRRVPVGTVTLPGEPVATGDRDTLVYRTKGGNLALRTPSSWSQSVDGSRPRLTEAHWEGDLLRVELDVPDGVGADWVRVRRRRDGDSREAKVEQGSTTVRVGRTSPGDVLDFYVHGGAAGSTEDEQRLVFAGAKVTQRPPHHMYGTVHGYFSIKDERRPVGARLRSQAGRLVRWAVQWRRSRTAG